MFQVPAAKRLKRSELFEDVEEHEHTGTHDASNAGVTHEIDSNHSPSYHFEFDYVETKSTSKTEPGDQTAVSDEFTFNLFRPAPRSSKTLTNNLPDQVPPPAAINRISIKSPSPPPDSISVGRFDKPRPESDYFTAAFNAGHQAALREQFAVSAISGETVQHLSTLPWPGSTCSWRIISLPAHSKQIVVDKTTRKGRLTAAALFVASAASNAPEHDEIPTARRRCRASKKRRIFMRVRAQKRVELQKVEEKRLETEQEKRAQKNRERKMKRKMKEKRDKEAKGRSEEAGTGNTPMDMD